MIRAGCGALLAAACLAVPAAAQSPAGMARAAAHTANSGAFDTLVTPDALRALQRLADSTRTQAEKPAPARSNPDAARPAARRTPPPKPPVIVEDPAPAAPAASGITTLSLERRGARSELRIVTAGPAHATLSEPFRAGQGTRLFLTFPGATLAIAAPAVDALPSAIGLLDVAQRDDGVRIALEAESLAGYGLETVADTTVLWVTEPAGAPVAAAGLAPAAARPAGPSELQLAGESARAGWNAFRRDVARVAAGTGALVTRVGGAAIDGARAAGGAIRTGVSSSSSTAGDASSAAFAWIAANVAFGAIARGIVFVSLLLAPPAAAILLMRRRRAVPARRAVAPIVMAPRASAPAEGTVGAATTPTPRTRTEIVALPEPPRALTRAEKKAARAIAKAEKKAARVAASNAGSQPARPAVTRTVADARLWAARTLADSGLDAAEIARQTGLSREAAGLLVRNARQGAAGA